MKSVRNFFLILTFSLASFVNAQNSEDVKTFINRTHLSIFKCQKEMINKSAKKTDQEFLKIVRDQAIAVKLYNAQKYSEALAYSNNSRLNAVKILEKLSPPVADFFQLNEEDKKTCKGYNLTLPADDNILTKEEDNSISSLDISNTQKIRELKLSVE